MNSIRSVISGTGSFIPDMRVLNSDFLQSTFFDPTKKKMGLTNVEIINKFSEITGIFERRYVSDTQATSDIAVLAAEDAINSCGIDKETLDFIIVAHNFGDVRITNHSSDMVPSIAARVKHQLDILNPYTLPIDVLFGCPGWLQGLIQAHIYLCSGDFKKGLVIGAETLSRVSDPHDRDSMIYADGAGAVIVESRTTNESCGVLSYVTRSDTKEKINLLNMGISNNPDISNNKIFLKMEGRKVYQYALEMVPQVVIECLQKAKIELKQINKILIHQANEKMDEAILKRICKLCGENNLPENIMPMTISWLGNSSVATIPTLLDLLVKGKLKDQKTSSGDTVVFASVGAGMNINAVIYKFP